MSKPSNQTPLRVIARSPFQIYYEGEAAVVSATNAVGRFDILPGHADFFSVLTADEIIIETTTDQSAEPICFNASNGMITVRDDQVMLFVNM